MSVDRVRLVIDQKLSAAASKRAEAERLKNEAVILEVEARAMEDALLLLIPGLGTSRNSAAHRVSTTEPVRIGIKASRNQGRQPGALSNKWKRYLLELREIGDTFGFDDVIRVVQKHEGRLMRQSEVKRLLDKWTPYDHVVVRDDRVSVPQPAADRFRATLGSASDEVDDPADGDEGVEENEAPEGASELASEMR